MIEASIRAIAAIGGPVGFALLLSASRALGGRPDVPDRGSPIRWHALLPAALALALAACGDDRARDVRTPSPQAAGEGAPVSARATPPAGTGTPASAVEATTGGGGGAGHEEPMAAPSPPPDPPAPPAVLVAAGDIAACDSAGDELTADLLDALPGTVATLGDNAYEYGSAAEFAACYAPSWGRHKDRTRPVPGNHDYLTPGAAGYFAYFGPAAGEPGLGYYSYDLGAWHVVALNSNCALVGCAAGSAQERWLRTDLAAHPARCTLAYWHHPRFSSGIHGGEPAVAPLWRALADAGAELVLAGHDHDYERFAPLDAAGRPDPERGLRQFVVGTGGRSLYPFPGAAQPGSEVRSAAGFGVLKLTLHEDRYEWEFVPVAGGRFTDRGIGHCH